MAPPTMTWVQGTARPITIAGTNATIDELLTAINDAVVAESTKWEVSSFILANHTLELKRKVSTSPTGEFATVRILFFGGATPNAAALTPVNATPLSTVLYGCLSVDANTTGPGTAFTAGAPYSSKFLQGDSIASNANIPAANTPRITIFETDEAFGFALTCTTAWCTYIGGKIIVRGSDNTELWANMCCGGNIATSITMANLGTAPINFAVPAYYDGGNNAGKPCYWNGSAVRQFGRRNAPVDTFTDQNLGASGATCCLETITICESAQANTQAETFFGTMRQIRLGPPAVNRTLGQVAAVTVAIFVGPINTAGPGIWLDQVA